MVSQGTLYIGIMSGTSLDGIDVALVDVQADNVKLLSSLEYPIPDALRRTLLSIASNHPTTIEHIGDADHQLASLYASAVNQLLAETGLKATQIEAIGCHGQTVFHRPNHAAPFTYQLGDANLLAIKTGITTVADFRRKDLALGGQGAPLVPAFHQFLFGQRDSTTVIANIGGIANISVLHAHTTLGYDTGPGNMLMDAWCLRHLGQHYDADAHWAKTGTVIPALLEQLMHDRYFALPAPKSTGREYFHLDWLQPFLSPQYAPQDVQRTLCELTAQTLADAVQQYQWGSTPRLYLCGGGANNPLLMDRLRATLPEWSVTTTSQHNVDSDFMEAMAFAWLAQRRMHNLPSNLPKVTGACRLTSLGVIYTAD
ncbi:anhydro-N-acetylmuramic acid kinase [Vibrio zhugei]|uniref:Anhydro-N-acetylmuramic acid kinase n=1 Tax=Vibrio zhugei TaxID=2479546 RepID=A0ABV7C645_9VIBR|nr:anhydro-N-acetylmuramic acid kinase [Vibrio zhugei]